MWGQEEMKKIVLEYGVGKEVQGEDLWKDLQLRISEEKFISALEAIKGAVSTTFEIISNKYACAKSGSPL